MILEVIKTEGRFWELMNSWMTAKEKNITIVLLPFYELSEFIFGIGNGIELTELKFTAIMSCLNTDIVSF